MTTIIKRCRAEKVRSIRGIDEFRKKLMIPDSEIPKCPEFEAKSKIGKIFKQHNPLEEYSVRIYEIDSYFYEHYEKKIQVDKNGCKYLLFKIDVHFCELLLAVEIDEKRLTDRDLTFEKKDKKHWKKNLVVNLLELIQVMQKNGYDLDYKVGNIEAFIDEFKNKKIKELEVKIKELEDKNKNLNNQLNR